MIVVEAEDLSRFLRREAQFLALPCGHRRTEFNKGALFVHAGALCVD
jgi:hypothetical protein